MVYPTQYDIQNNKVPMEYGAQEYDRMREK